MNQESEEDDLIADNLESSVVRNLDTNNTTIRIEMDNKIIATFKPEMLSKIEGTFRDRAVEGWGILSMVYLDFQRDFNVIWANDTEVQNKIKPEVFREITRLSLNKSRVPVIIFPSLFEDRFLRYFNARNESYSYGFVNYYSGNSAENIGVAEYDNHPEHIIFNKHNKFSYQKEFRFALTQKIDGDGEKFRLGSMQNVAAKYVNADDLLQLQVNLKK